MRLLRNQRNFQVVSAVVNVAPFFLSFFLFAAGQIREGQKKKWRAGHICFVHFAAALLRVGSLGVDSMAVEREQGREKRETAAIAFIFPRMGKNKATK